MKRKELIATLIKEGFTEKTLANFTDKQINDLSLRILGEATKTIMTTYDSKKPEDVKALNAALHDPRTDHSTINVKEGKRLSPKQSEKMDTDKDGDIDAKDLKNLRNKKVKGKVVKNYKQNEDAQMKEKNKKAHMAEEKKKEKWIQKAVHPSKKGALKKALGVKKDEKIPTAKLKSAAKKGGKLGQRARFAMNVKGLKESKEEIVNWVDNLVKENYHPLTTKGNIIKLVQKNIKK